MKYLSLKSITVMEYLGTDGEYHFAMVDDIAFPSLEDRLNYLSQLEYNLWANGEIIEQVNLCGIILMSLRYMEAWWLWLVNNVLDLTIWTCILFVGGSGAIMMFITCIMYLVINAYGIWKWMKSSKVEQFAA